MPLCAFNVSPPNEIYIINIFIQCDLKQMDYNHIYIIYILSKHAKDVKIWEKYRKLYRKFKKSYMEQKRSYRSFLTSFLTI